MNATVMAVLMILTLMGLLMWNRLPLPVVMLAVPLGFGLAHGYALSDLLSALSTQFGGVMGSIGYMLLFSFLYFQMLTETGMFDTVIAALMRAVGQRLNAATAFFITILVGLIVGVTTNMIAVYLIVFGVMIPLYRRFEMDRLAAIVLAQTAATVFCFVPWSYNLILGVAAVGGQVAPASAAAMPWCLCLIPVLLGQAAYFSLRHKRQHGTLALPQGAARAQAQSAPGPNARPKLFWFNLIGFGLVVAALTLLSLPSWFVFCVAACVTTLANYRKDYGPIWNKAAAPFVNILIMLLAVSAYIAVFNYTPEGGASLAASLADWLVGAVPPGLMRYTALIFVALSVLIVRVMPYQILIAMCPMLASIGAAFGLPGAAVVAPLVCYMNLGMGISPMTASTYVAASLADVDLAELGRRGLCIMLVSEWAALALAGVCGLWPV